MIKDSFLVSKLGVNIVGLLINPFFVISNDLDKFHPFETYYNNPDLQIQQIIQNTLIENELKEKHEAKVE
ncbi:MAG: hypothetical protein K2I71_02080 [Helicobacter sp.]|nr:hypothetical protein [Helicobacter sp.]